MASSAAAARLRELAPAPAPAPAQGVELDAPGAAALAECCAGLLLRPGDAEAAREALEALYCAAGGGGGAMRGHADGLAPLVVARLGDADAAVREAARRFLVLLMEVPVLAFLQMINDEDAETHQRHLPPVESIKQSQPQLSSCTPAVMDKVVKVDSETSFSSGDLQPSQRLKLGPPLLPYLEGLDSAQLQLVTTYASRLSRPRFIAADG